MLNVEQPDPERSADQHDRHLHEEERPETGSPNRDRRGQDNGEVGRHGAQPRLPARAHQPDRQAVLQEKQIGRTETEHHQRMPVGPVAQPAPARQRQIFADRQRIDVADAAPVEIAELA